VIDPHVIWVRDQILERIRVAKAVKAADLHQVAASAHDGAIAAYIAMNDPATVTATCLAELAILAEHRSSGAFTSPAPEQERCVVCDTDYPCNTVRRLHDAYRRQTPW
jgi:hypothetical protein